MVRSQKAFTLIELMIVVAIIAIIAAIAIPSLISSRIASYETAAAGTLRSLAAAQSTFVARCLVDQDGDGAGEYGFLQELAGAVTPRTRLAALAPGEVFSAAMGNVTANGTASKSGYAYILYLPTGAGAAVTESTGAVPAAAAVDANVQETRWACYAWPMDYGSTGYRCFVVNQQAEVYQASNEQAANTPYYNGDGTQAGDVIAPPTAAYDPGSPNPANLDGSFPSPGNAAVDTQLWSQASGG